MSEDLNLLQERLSALEATLAELRERLTAIEVGVMWPADLAGQRFHHIVDGVVHRRGTVVGPTSPGIFLLLFDDAMGEPAFQTLVALGSMISDPDTPGEAWHFFDDEEWARAALHAIPPE